MGNMTSDKFGFSGPVWTPLYPAPPWPIPESENLLMFYEADPEAVLEALPAGCELLGDRPIVQVLINHSLSGTAGDHYGNYIFPQCKFAGKPYAYEYFLMVSNDVAMAMGREVWGDAKKLCHTEWHREGNELFTTIERPRGLRLVTTHFRFERQCTLEDLACDLHPGLCLKYIPSSEGIKPVVHQYVEDSFALQPLPGGNLEIWAGTGSLWMDALTEVIPIYRLRPKKMLGAYYIKCGFKLGYGTVLKDFLSNDQS